MEYKLNDYLIEGEKILWTGSPDFVALDKTNKPFIIGKAVAMIVAMAIFLIYYLSQTAAGAAELKFSVFVIVAALAALVVLPEILDANKLKKTIYAVTDRRLISIVSGSVESVEYSKIKEYTFETDKDGQISLLCGERAMSSKPRLRRLLTILGTRLSEDKNVCESFVFYGVPEADKVKKLVAKYI